MITTRMMTRPTTTEKNYYTDAEQYAEAFILRRRMNPNDAALKASLISKYIRSIITTSDEEEIETIYDIDTVPRREWYVTIMSALHIAACGTTWRILSQAQRDDTLQRLRTTLVKEHEDCVRDLSDAPNDHDDYSDSDCDIPSSPHYDQPLCIYCDDPQ